MNGEEEIPQGLNSSLLGKQPCVSLACSFMIHICVCVCVCACVCVWHSAVCNAHYILLNASMN